MEMVFIFRESGYMGVYIYFFRTSNCTLKFAFNCDYAAYKNQVGVLKKACTSNSFLASTLCTQWQGCVASS